LVNGRFALSGAGLRMTFEKKRCLWKLIGGELGPRN
jgi:hypothetical protein